MTSTTAFKNIRAIGQLCSLLILLLNIPMIIAVYYYGWFIELERTDTMLGFRGMEEIQKNTLFINLTLGLFAGCGVNSKNKFYMRCYLVASFFLCIILTAYCTYVAYKYPIVITSAFSNAFSANPGKGAKYYTHFKCFPNEPKCFLEIKRVVDEISRFYLIPGVSALLLNLTNFVLIKVAVEIDINAPKPKIPTFVQKTKVGMDTTFLRQKQIIVNHPNN